MVADLLDLFLGLLPNLIGFVVILVIFGGTSYVIFWVLRFVARKAAGAMVHPDAQRMAVFIKRVGKWLVAGSLGAITLKLAVGALGIEALDEPFDAVIAWIPKLIVALALLTVPAIVVVPLWLVAVRGTNLWVRLLAALAAIGIAWIFVMASLDQAGAV